MVDVASQNADKLAILEASLRAVGRQNRTLVELAHFDAYFSPTPDRIQNFAVPRLPNPSDWTKSVAELISLFKRRKRSLRLEFFHELHPHLAQTLEAAGLVCERQDPVMILMKESLATTPPPLPDGSLCKLESTNEPLLRAFLQNQSVAYGGSDDESALGWLPNFINGLGSGALMGHAVEKEGQLIAGASIQIGGGIGELAGVWTAPEARRQGYAHALCYHLLERYFAAGFGLCWLSAAEGAQTLYRRLGFAAIGTQLNYGLTSGFEH